MTSIGIIPARYGSTRFEGKPLAMIAGKSMIQRVYEQACKAKSLAKVVVATDDERIFQHVTSFGGQAVMTSEHCLNGTERCAETIAKLSEKYDFAINIQGDEPFIQPEQIDLLVLILEKSSEFQVATLAKRITESADLFNPNIVKAVISVQGRALYFSRQALPFVRGTPPENWLENHNFYKHIGLYAYKTDILPYLSALKASPLELAESLEQLRWLENNISIGIAETPYETMGIDTPEDLEKAILAVGGFLGTRI
jgi:3-deoxy-manno-octulosonate cytidylyltransferase (CMP-KDO synthetase)